MRERPRYSQLSQVVCAKFKSCDLDGGGKRDTDVKFTPHDCHSHQIAVWIQLHSGLPCDYSSQD